MDDFKKEKSTYLNVHQISDKLVKCVHNISHDHENRVRQLIRKIQISFQKITNAEVISNVYLSGYRLNIENILLKIKKSKKIIIVFEVILFEKSTHCFFKNLFFEKILFDF